VGPKLATVSGVVEVGAVEVVKETRTIVQEIISGGQTGADRAGLDLAIAHGIRHAGWCPKGRIAEDGVIHSRYALDETPSVNYVQRTAWNVRDSRGDCHLHRFASTCAPPEGGWTSAITWRSTRSPSRSCRRPRSSIVGKLDLCHRKSRHLSVARVWRWQNALRGGSRMDARRVGMSAARVQDNEHR